MKPKDPFYDEITFDYLLKGNGNDGVYLCDIMRFFEVDIDTANKLKPKVEELIRRLNESKS